MVLFTERETLLLLDMYLRLRTRAENVAANGVLLKAPARAKLTRAINRSSGDSKNRVWTEGQVFVKFKNLRVDYAQVKWLQEQPGFRDNGEGLSKDWWAAIKTQRPKAHVFKGKLPWPFFSRMAMILQDAPYVSEADAATEQRISELLAEGSDASGDDAADAGVADVGSAPATSDDDVSDQQQATAPVVAAPTPSTRRATPAPTLTPVAPAHVTPKRARAAADPESPHTPALSYSKRSRSSLGGSSNVAASPAHDEQSTRRESLSRSVEQFSAAAASMARGFQGLVSAFQSQAEKCRDLESVTSDVNADAVAAERQVLLSIARSVEKSTQASADMARGYHDLIEHYIRESESRRLL